MIYFIAVMLVLFFWAMIDIVVDDVKEEKKKKYTIPPEFWDDYNQLMFFIERMNIHEVEKMQNMVTDLIAKYHNCIEYNAFSEKIGLMITILEKKKRVFLLNTHLN